MRTEAIVTIALACGGASAPRPADVAPLPTNPAPAASSPEVRAENPCDETHCTGRAGDKTADALGALAHQTRRKCYEPALASDPKLQGQLVLRMKIASSGAICSADAEKSDLPAPLADCVANVFESAKAVDAPEGGCVVVEFPLRYVPKTP